MMQMGLPFVVAPGVEDVMDLPNSIITLIADVDIAARICGHAEWLEELCDGPGAVSIARCASGEGGDNPAGCYLPDPIILYIGDVDIAASVNGYAGWQAELRGGAGAVLMARGAVAGEAGDSPDRGDLPNPIVVAVGDVNIAARIGSFGLSVGVGVGFSVGVGVGFSVGVGEGPGDMFEIFRIRLLFPSAM
jgi:hypothetical protein